MFSFCHQFVFFFQARIIPENGFIVVGQAGSPPAFKRGIDHRKSCIEPSGSDGSYVEHGMESNPGGYRFVCIFQCGMIFPGECFLILF